MMDALCYCEEQKTVETQINIFSQKSSTGLHMETTSRRTNEKCEFYISDKTISISIKIWIILT